MTWVRKHRRSIKESDTPHLSTRGRATAELEQAGFSVREGEPLPYHYVLVATHPGV